MAERRHRLKLEPVGHWTPGEFHLASIFAAVEMAQGWLWQGVAMQKLWRGSPKGRRPPAWGLIHCGSSHRICIIEAHQEEAFAIADQVVVLADWTFDGLDGWKNTDPDLPERLRALAMSHGKRITVRQGGSSHEAAQAIALARAS